MYKNIEVEKIDNKSQVLDNNEFHLVCDFLNREAYEPNDILFVHELITHLIESLNYFGIDLKWDVDINVFINKLDKLPHEQTKVLFHEVDAFWCTNYMTGGYNNFLRVNNG